MNEETKQTFIFGIIASVIIIGSICGLYLYIHHTIKKSEQEFNSKILDNINLSKPFNEVVAIDSDIVCCSEYLYYVSILVTTDEYPDAQWIYDFTYNSDMDKLFYYGNIEGIGVK